MAFIWTGLDGLKADLRGMPERLTKAATNICVHRANIARGKIDAAYPLGPEKGGHLKGKTKVTVQANEHGVIATVRNNAKNALSFEYGTQVRRNSKNSNRGAAPPGNVFMPIADREQEAAHAELVDLLVRNGHEVSGAR